MIMAEGFSVVGITRGFFNRQPFPPKKTIIPCQGIAEDINYGERLPCTRKPRHGAGTIHLTNKPEGHS